MNARLLVSATMLALGILLFVVLTFVAALIAGVGQSTALVIVAVTIAVLSFSRRRARGRESRS
jgi:hypothetical protein